MGDRPPQARAAPRRRQGDPLGAADPRWRAVSGRGRGRPRLARGRALHPHHLAPRATAPEATARWLEQIGLPYDELYCSYDKVTRCEEIGIDLLIDDSPENLRRAIDAGIAVATIAHPGTASCARPRTSCAARTGWSSPATSSRCWRHEAAPGPEHRPARLPAGDRARAPGLRLGPLRARRGPARQDRLRVPLPLLVPLRGRGDRERPRRRRRAAGLQPLGRAPARRDDDPQGGQGGAPAPAARAPDRRALLQGQPAVLDAGAEDRRRARPPGQRPAPALRRGPARARLPRGPQGHREALQGPLPAAALRARRLRRGRHARAGPDRPDRGRRRRGVDAGVRPARHAPAPHRLLYFPITPTFPHLGLLGFLGYLPAKFKIRFLEPIPTDQWGPEPHNDRGLVQSVADEIRARIQEELYDMVAKRNSVWFG